MPEFYSKKHSPWNGTFLTRGAPSGSIMLPWFVISSWSERAFADQCRCIWQVCR